MNLFELILFVWRWRYVVGGLGLLFAIVGVAVALTRTPIYRADVLLMPRQQEESIGGITSLMGQFGGLASLAGLSLGGANDSEEAIAYLQSRQLTEMFIIDRSGGLKRRSYTTWLSLPQRSIRSDRSGRVETGFIA